MSKIIHTPRSHTVLLIKFIFKQAHFIFKIILVYQLLGCQDIFDSKIKINNHIIQVYLITAKVW